MAFLFQTERLVLREVRPGDRPHYVSLVRNGAVTKHIFGDPLNEKDANERFEQVLRDSMTRSGFGGIIIFLKNEPFFVGMGKLTFWDEEKGEAEIGYMLPPENWGKGYATEIAAGIVNYAWSLPEIKSLIAIIDPENPASGHVLEKVGFGFSHAGEFDGLPAHFFKMNHKNTL